MTDQEFHERCEAAIGKVDPSPALVVQWRACATRWGPKSPAALGVLEAIAAKAWDPKRVVVQTTAAGGWRPVVYDRCGKAWTRVDVERFFLASHGSRVGALVEALESAPR